MVLQWRVMIREYLTLMMMVPLSIKLKTSSRRSVLAPRRRHCHSRQKKLTQKSLTRKEILTPRKIATITRSQTHGVKWHCTRVLAWLSACLCVSESGGSVPILQGRIDLWWLRKSLWETRRSVCTMMRKDRMQQWRTLQGSMLQARPIYSWLIWTIRLPITLNWTTKGALEAQVSNLTQQLVGKIWRMLEARQRVSTM